MDTAIAGVGVAVVAALLGVLVTWVTTRRTASGKIGTSEAAVLWDQAQAMRAELVAQRDKAIEQRDRLIESQTAQLMPALTGINSSLRQITDTLAGNGEMLRQTLGSLTRLEAPDGQP